MNINDIMLRDMAEAKAKAEAERAERDERAIRRADKITNVGCALLSVLAVATLLLIAVALFWDKAHKRALFGAQRRNRELPITNCTVTIGSPLFEGATGDLYCGDKKLTFTNGVLHAVSD
jgi:hypothetical protein